MNHLGKKMLTGTFAAGLILGGAGLAHNSVFAAASTDTSSTGTSPAVTGTASTAAAAQKKADRGRHGGEFKSGGLVKTTADLLGMTESDVLDQLGKGSTYAEIAQAKGLSKEAYLSKLIAAETTEMNDRLSSGKITQEQADQQKESLSERLSQIIDSSETGRGHGRGYGHGRGFGFGFGRIGKPEEVAQIIGMTEDEVKAGLQSGKSLAELAQAKGMSEEQLIQKLKDNMTDELIEWVNSKHAPSSTSTGAGTDTDTDANLSTTTN
ncbi:hypothetical protein [Paenibacillus thermotolerans]|uniref:hypothetical protein n=1 Tax=Paenibacillus thermotolerans TaxID=3027807 RepID=UPI0023681C9A|nr:MULTISPECIES: hypothetical protein [unclassified Paenibacillus]